MSESNNSNSKLYYVYVGVFVVLFIGVILYKAGLFHFTEPKQEVATTATANVQSDETNVSVKEISSITKQLVGSEVTTKGKVIERREHQKGHVFLTLEDNSGKILVPIFADKNIESNKFQKNKELQVTGTVDIYNNELEIIPNKASDVVEVTNQLLGQIVSEETVGQKVNVKVAVQSAYDSPKGHVFLTATLLDNNQEIEVPLFDTLNPEANSYPAGTVLDVTGTVSTYKDKLQVIPASIDNVTIVQAGTAKSVKHMSISSITKDQRGEKVIVEGMVSDVVNKGDHFFFMLRDGNQQIKSVLFKEDGNEIEGRKERILNAESSQFKLRLLGTIDVYNDELEVVIDKVLVD